MLNRFKRWGGLVVAGAGRIVWAIIRHRWFRRSAAAVAGLLLLVWLDAWLLGSLAALATMATEGRPDLSVWRSTWLLTPIRTAMAMMQPAAEATEAREMWLTLQLPYWGGIGWLSWKIYQWGQVKGYESDKATFGSSRWMQPQEIRRFLKAGLGQGLILGKLDGTWYHYPYEYPPKARGRKNQFVLVYGGSGKGKGRGFVIPNTLNEAQASIIVTDPKGEIYAMTAASMEAKGYTVWVVNLLRDGKRVSMQYNPVGYCRNADQVYRFVDTLMSNTSNPEQSKSGDPFWENAERAYLEALTLYLITERPEAERHMPSLLKLATRLPRDPEGMDKLFDGLKEDHPARASYDIYRLAEDKTRAGILIGSAVRLRLWGNPDLAAMMGRNDFDLRELGRRRVILYLLIPDDEATYAPVTSMLFAQAIQELYDEAGRRPGQRLEIPVRLRIDEAANVGRIPDFAKKVSTMRGRGISPEIILQGPSQGWDLYGSTWEAIEENCDWQLFLGGNSLKSAKITSEKLGIQTVRTESSSEKGTTEGTSQRQLMTPDEVRRLTDDDQIVFPGGALPIRLKKIDFTDMPQWRSLEERNPLEFQPPPREPLVITPIDALLPQAPAEKPKAAPKPKATQAEEGQPPADAPVSDPAPARRDPLTFLDRR